MDRLQAMEVFARVVEAGSFSAAAKHLGMGQPSVSKTISALEASLGVRLLARSTRQVHPTEAGQSFYERTLRALAEVAEAEAAAKGSNAGLEGRLRVCAPVTFARLHLAPHLSGFLDQHLKLSLDFIMDDRSIDLLAEGIDVALRLGAMADSSLTARKLGAAARLLVASPAYLARHGEPQCPDDLATHWAVIYGQAAEAWRFRRGAEEQVVRPQTRLTCSAAEGVREAVFAGLGLTVASRWMIGDGLDRGALQALLPEWRLPHIELWGVFPAGRLPSAKARAFLAWVQRLHPLSAGAWEP